MAHNCDFSGLIKSATPVGSALKSDPFHRAAVFASDLANGGQKFIVKGDDGAERILIQVKGELNGVPGRFEWIVDPKNNTLTHQMFVPNGVINGVPIIPK